MKKVKNLKQIILAVVVAFCLASPAVLAVDPACQKFADQKNTTAQKDCEDQTPTACLNINRSAGGGEDKFDNCLSQHAVSANNPISKDINIIVDFLSAGVGIFVTAMIIVGGIQYSIAGDNSTQTANAKKRIANAVIALVVFMFIFAFLQWLIPGGIFG
ncbi:MAG TPA: pilin [Candidatus Saccharimonadales bacterium]|nr:pilin [Candidatus Saccharimonadales bacterium]